MIHARVPTEYREVPLSGVKWGVWVVNGSCDKYASYGMSGMPVV